jgi:hypothetical protein
MVLECWKEFQDPTDKVDPTLIIRWNFGISEISTIFPPTKIPFYFRSKHHSNKQTTVRACMHVCLYMCSYHTCAFTCTIQLELSASNRVTNTSTLPTSCTTPRYEQLVNWITKQLAYWTQTMNNPDTIPYMQADWRLFNDGRRNGLPNGFQNWLDKQNYAELITHSDAKRMPTSKSPPRAIMWNVRRTITTTHMYRQWVCDNTCRNTPLKMTPSNNILMTPNLTSTSLLSVYPSQTLLEGKAVPYRPRKALRAPGGRGSQVFRQSAHEGGKVVSPKHRPPLAPQERFLVLISVRGWVDPRATVRPKRLCQWKIPVTPLGIEPATFRFVALCLNQLRHRDPISNSISSKGM